MADADAYFEQVGTPDGTAYRPTGHTQGPWNPEFQHFGPPGALLTRELERCAGDDLPLARISFDILGPVPLRPLTVRAEVERPGRRVRLVRAELLTEGRVVALAAGWGVQPAPEDVPIDTGSAQKPPSPRPQAPGAPPEVPDHWRCGFLESVEWSFVHGGYETLGPAAVWLRPRIPLLPDEPMSPTQRTVLCADSANGVSAVLDIRQYGFVPPELTLHLLRPPAGEWLCLDADTELGPGHAGLTCAMLHDEHGPVARSAQSLLVHRR
ncbi:thioesterase family protein [Kitasatospora cystarginea]|uniref:Thioesterase family protein n=1 Tax=Kitasatospora cystarginea TaxID=58350 RepID=A0ABN3EUL9_9ACTN